jgi:selenide,water dikinase
MIPGGANDNRAFLEPFVTVASTIDKRLDAVLYDPQTSGGLFIAIPEANAEAFLADANQAELPAVRIGQVEPCGVKPLVVD